MNYLLPAQTLLDLCDTRANAARTWATTVDTLALRVSVISIAEAQSRVDAVVPGNARSQLDARLRALLNQLANDNGPPLAFDEPHADVWRSLLNEPAIHAVGATDLQNYAIAVHEGLTVVEEQHPYTASLQQLNVQIHIL